MPGTAPSSVTYMAPERGAYANVQGQQLIAAQGIAPVGGTTDIELIKGIHGMIKSNTAMTQELQGVARQIVALNERTTRMLGSSSTGIGGMSHADMSNAVAEGTAKAMLGVAAGVMAAVQGMQGQGEAGVAPEGAMSPMAALGGSGAAGGYTGPTPPPPHGSGPPEARPGLSPYEQFQRGRNYNVGALRQDLASHVTRRLSESQWAGEELTETAPGSGIYQRPDGSVASPAMAAQFLRRSRIMGKVTGALGQMGEGGSVGQGLATLMPRGAAIAGKFAGAAALGYQALQFVGDQRAENAQFQSVLGGSNVEGMMERGRSKLFRYNQLGMMQGEQAEQLYSGVIGAGLRGGTRDRALEFGASAYRKFGLSVQDSVALIQQAADQGATSFDFLTNSLTMVTKAARDAGVNAQVMQRQFAAGMAANTPTMGINNAAGVSAAETAANAGFGRAIGGQITNTGMNDTTQILMQSRMAGMGVNQYLATINDPTNPRAALAVRDRNLTSVAARLLGTMGVRMVRDAIARKGGALTPAEFEALARQYQREGGPFNALIGPQIVEQLTGRGGLTPATVIPALMTALAGGTTMGSVSAAGRFDAEQQARGIVQGAPGALTAAQQEQTDRTAGIGPGGIGGGNVLTARFNDTLNIGRSNAEERRRAQGIYREGVEKTGRGGGISAALVDQFQGDRRIRVRTANGDRLVTTDDALRYFRDQVDRGDAVIEEGADAGKTLAEAMGMSGDANIKVTSDKETRFGGKGRAADSGKGGNKVEITMSPELRRFFQANPIGGTDPNANLQPPNSRSTPNGYATDSSRG